MKFRILGPLEVLDDGAPVDVVAGKQRALLADLLLNANRAVPVTKLVDDLWGDRVPETAVKAIQVNVSRLRKVLPAGRLRTHGPGYVLEVGEDELDLAEFTRLGEAGRQALLDRDAASASRALSDALALWRGPALAEIDEPFAEIEGPRLEELRLGCLEQRIEADLQLGRHATLVAELEALVATQPMRESFRSQLMLALYRSGRQAESLEVHQGFRRKLDEDLGIEPSQALRDLERQILQQDPALDWEAPASFGRRDERNGAQDTIRRDGTASGGTRGRARGAGAADRRVRERGAARRLRQRRGGRWQDDPRRSRARRVRAGRVDPRRSWAVHRRRRQGRAVSSGARRAGPARARGRGREASSHTYAASHRRGWRSCRR